MPGQVIVSASTGVMNSLPAKLAYLQEQAKMKGSERKEVMSLKEEVGSMGAVLLESAMMKAPDVQVKEWMRQVREVSYDIEDFVDVYVHRHQHGRSSKSLFLQHMPPLFFWPLVRPSRAITLPPVAAVTHGGTGFAKKIRQLKARVVDANDRRTRYNLAVPHTVPGSDAGTAADDDIVGEVTVDPRLLDMEETVPVAIDGPRDELVRLLADKEQHVKVASIVGMAGIGKTTLATHVRRQLQLQEHFDCYAFVYVGRRPCIRAVLMDIINQVSQQKHDDIMGEHDAMNRLRDLLDHKRYLIIMDDLWSVSAWKAINCALPENCRGSRVIATTRIHDVARSCSNHPSDSIYEMKTLDYSDSKKLFHNRIFDSEDECFKECSDVHDSVLKVCGGLPWTIIVVASYLARTAKPEEWKMVHRSTLSALEQYPPVQGMRKMLHISYTSLPLPIKSCLLYLSVFPKNYKINKGRLIWRWIAEGFIPSSGDENPWETGKNYFNELINRCLIQPVFTDDDDDNDLVGCTVHGSIYDFIVSMSSEENFVILDDELKSMPPRDVIRRLSVNYAKQEDGTKLALDHSGGVNLSQARSLTVFGSAQLMPHLASFLLLRVLDLEDAESLESGSLEGLGRLFNLRYLGLGGRRVTELPEAIGELRFLETLEVRRTRVRKLPQGAARLQKLARLQAEALDDIPDGMDKLQELATVNVGSRRSLAFLAKLRRLRALGVKWCFRDDLAGDIQSLRNEFVASLKEAAGSESLASLCINSGDACSLNFLADSWSPPHKLQKLVMKASSSPGFPRINKNLASCKGITYLEIAINLDREQDLMIIADLPDLTILKLSVTGKPVVIGQRGFGRVRVFWFERREGGLDLIFQQGAMPLLRKLRLHFKLQAPPPQHGGCFQFGLRHLSCLKMAHVTVDCDGAMAAEVASVEHAIKEEIRAHGKKPKLELSRNNEEKMVAAR
ncbi:hypothetical protein ACP4OV_026874 [Aristida adscensionis]